MENLEEFENKELLEEAIAKVKAHCPEKAKEFALQSNMTYSKETGDTASHLKYCKKYAKTIATDADELAKLATDLGKTYKDNAAVSKFGEKISAKSVKVGGRFFHYITYAQFLKRNDKTDKAKDAAKKALDTHGYGMSSVRFICGTTDIHRQLEEKIAEFFGTEDTILYAACFDANGGVFEPLLTKEDAIISDSLNHCKNGY